LGIIIIYYFNWINYCFQNYSSLAIWDLIPLRKGGLLGNSIIGIRILLRKKGKVW